MLPDSLRDVVPVPFPGFAVVRRKRLTPDRSIWVARVHLNIMMIGLSLNVSLQKKWPTLFSNEPTTGGSRTPTLLATQYKLHNLVFGLNRRTVRPSNRFPSWPRISCVEYGSLSPVPPRIL